MKIWAPLVLLPLLAVTAVPALAQQSLPQAVDRLRQDVRDLERLTATITADEFGDIYTVYDADGEVMLLIEVDKDGGRLSTRNLDGTQVTFFGASETGGRLVNVNRADGETVVFLNVDDDGGRISTRNHAATQVTFLGSDEDGNGLINVNNSQGEGMVYLLVDEDGGQISVQDRRGDTAVLIAADSRGRGLIQVGGDRVHDTAEVFDLASRDGVVPGSVMAADAGGSGALLLAAIPYDRRAVGVISGAGDFQHGLVIGSREDGSQDLPIALSGQVYVRVTGENGPIVPGDLLVSSSTPGAAMRAGDMHLAFGAVIGKALQGFAEGEEGLIRMLVMVR